MVKEIVILGANFTGIATVRDALKIDKTAHLTVISPSTHAFFNPSVPRALVNPKYPSQMVFELKETFAKEIAEKRLTLIQGKAVKSNFATNEVTYISKGQEKVVKYDLLVLATGSRTENKALKLHENHEETLTHLQDAAAKAKAAKTIVVAGGGPTGVETAGELKENYPNAEVTLYTGSKGPLESFNKINAATKKLNALGVKTINNVRITSYEETSDEKTKLVLSDGKTKVVDFYFPAVGVIPNTEYIDSGFLDKDGFVVVEPTLLVKGTKNVMVVGDLLSGSPCTVVDYAFCQKAVIISTLKHVLTGSIPSKKYSASKSTTVFVPISSKAGVGLMFGWSVPNFMVVQGKSKHFLLPNAKGYLGAN